MEKGRTKRGAGKGRREGTKGKGGGGEKRKKEKGTGGGGKGKGRERKGMIFALVKIKQESCAIAKMTAQCALHMGALKIFGTP